MRWTEKIEYLDDAPNNFEIEESELQELRSRSICIFWMGFVLPVRVVRIVPLSITLSLLLPLSGCGKSNDEATAKNLTELFPGSAPSFPPQASKLTNGVMESQAKALVPDIFNAKYQELMLPAYGKRVLVSASFFSAGSEGKWLRHVELHVPKETGLAAIEKQWGAPLTFEVQKFGSAGTESRHVWFNPAKSLRALSTPHAGYPDVLKIMIGEYLAPEALIGKKGELGANNTPIIGASVTTLQKAFGERFTTREAESITGAMQTIGKVVLPPVGRLRHELSADISFEGSVATGYDIVFSGSEDATSKAILAQLEAVFGAGKPAKSLPNVTVYPAEVGVSAEASKNRVRIRVGIGGKSETE